MYWLIKYVYTKTTPYNKYIAKLIQKEVTAQPSIMSRNLYRTASSLSPPQIKCVNISPTLQTDLNTLGLHKKWWTTTIIQQRQPMTKAPDLGQAHNSVAGLNVFLRSQLSPYAFIIDRTNINNNWHIIIWNRGQSNPYFMHKYCDHILWTFLSVYLLQVDFWKFCPPWPSCYNWETFI